MNSFRAVLLTAVTAFGVVGAAAATAGETEAHRTMTVNYDDLNIHSDQGAKALYSRLRTAARRVCINFQGKELRQKEQWMNCFNESLARAVTAVNQERLTALHRSKSERV